MTLTRILILALLLFNIDAYSQFSEFEYSEDFCSYKATFDSTKYTRAQLQNTLDHLCIGTYFQSKSTAWNPDQVKKLNVADVQAECSEIIHELETLEFVDDPFWAQLRQKRIEFYKSSAKLIEITILAYTNPEVLLDYDLVDSTCIYYRDALIAGNQDMLDAWIKLNEIKKSKNGNPELVQRKFDEKYNSQNRLEYARIDIMQFGWWNNANHLLPHINEEQSFFEELKKVFVEIDYDCLEP